MALVDPLLARCPQLTSVHSRVLPEPTPVVVTALRSLTLDFPFQVLQSRLFPRLTSLSLGSLVTDETLQALGEHCAALTVCCVDTNTPLRSLQHVTDLDLVLRPPTSLSPIPPLTNLTTLKLNRGSFADQMALALHFLRACPALSANSISAACNCS